MCEDLRTHWGDAQKFLIVVDSRFYVLKRCQNFPKHAKVLQNVRKRK